MAQTKPKNQPKPQKKIPERRCVGCMGTFEKRELIRIVRAPADTTANTSESGVPSVSISIDFTGKKSGRGAYICKSESCLKKARKSGALSRALECEISPEIYDDLEREIRAFESENGND